MRLLCGRRVEQIHLVRCRPLKHLAPAPQVVKRYRWRLHVTALNSLEQNLNWGIQQMKFDCGSQRSCFGPKQITLRPPPGSPLNDHISTEAQDLSCDIPLQLLDSLPRVALPEIYTDRIHPLVSTKTDGMQVPLNLCRVNCLARAW
jgi:hypothetical protein